MAWDSNRMLQGTWDHYWGSYLLCQNSWLCPHQSWPLPHTQDTPPNSPGATVPM